MAWLWCGKQASGGRCVTAVVGEGSLGTTHSGRDALGFAIHDLKHMEKFVDPEFHLEQVCVGGLSGS